MREVQEAVGETILENNLRIVTQAQDQILDRVNNGEVSMMANPKYDRTKRKSKKNPTHIPIRTAAKLRDLTIAAGVSFDKARTSQYKLDQKSGAAQEHIDDLIKKFAASLYPSMLIASPK